MAMLGAASITGVPPLGLPKINSLVGRIFMPAFSASPRHFQSRIRRFAILAVLLSGALLASSTAVGQTNR
jgi:hypothetical protein